MVKIQKGIFQRDALSPLLFVIMKIPLNLILGKFTGGYDLTESQGKIIYLIYREDVKPFAKKNFKFRN